jgi:hypothetical protein
VTYVASRLSVVKPSSSMAAGLAALGGDTPDTTVPGVDYGLSPFFRISTATSDAILSEAIGRIAAAVAHLKPAQAAA